MQVGELINRAVARTGTAANLADQLGVTFQEVSNWKNGRRTCPPDMRAAMAAMIGLDPMAELAAGYAAGLSEKRKDQLRRALQQAGCMCLEWWVRSHDRHLNQPS